MIEKHKCHNLDCPESSHETDICPRAISMINSNCLEGIRCPKCGEEGGFQIRASATFSVTDDGTDNPVGVEWDGKSSITCNDCRHHGTVSEFMEESA